MLMNTTKQNKPVRSISDLVRADRSTGDVMLVLDFSSSMGGGMANGKTRVDGLRDAVKQIQAQAPTAMVIFYRNDATFVTSIDHVQPEGGTPLAQGLELACRSCSRVIVVSDGCPNDELYALEVGRKLGRCDCIFVGDVAVTDEDGNIHYDHGREFLALLAKETGGTMFDGDLAQVKTLVSHVVALLGDGQ